MKHTLVALSLVGLAGCAASQQTAAQREDARMQSALVEGQAQIDSCIKNMKQSDAYRALEEKLPPPGTDPSMALLADTTRPTQAEVPLLLAYHRETSLCREPVLKGLSAAHPSMALVAANFYTSLDQAFARLVKREISWGDYAQLRQQARQTAQAKGIEAEAAITANLKNSHRYEMQQRQVSAAAFERWAAVQRASMPTFTTCSYVGALLTCTTF